MTPPLNKSDWDALQAIYNADTLLTQNVEVAVQQLHKFFRLAFDEAKRAHAREVELEARATKALQVAVALAFPKQPIARSITAPCMN
jgi:hypothetical protein